MKSTSTSIATNLLSNFDRQLLAILKADIRNQNQKVKATLINMATRTYDSELLSIIKADISKIKGVLSGANNSLANVG